MQRFSPFRGARVLIVFSLVVGSCASRDSLHQADGAAAGGGSGSGGMSGAGGAGTQCPLRNCGDRPIANHPCAGTPDDFVCARDTDGVCRWFDGLCTAHCPSVLTVEGCAKVGSCQWLMPGCGGPASVEGCFARQDVGSCSPTTCAPPRICQEVTVDSCTLETGRVEPSCADDVCRDRSVGLCHESLQGTGGTTGGSGGVTGGSGGFTGSAGGTGGALAR